jgi:hypothetical protein
MGWGWLLDLTDEATMRGPVMPFLPPGSAVFSLLPSRLRRLNLRRGDVPRLRHPYHRVAAYLGYPYNR